MTVSDATNEQAKQELVSLLKENRAVLMVGAGSSKPVNYPLWDELAEEMGARLLAPPLLKGRDVLPTIFIDQIKEKLRVEKRQEDYFNFLERKFEPKSGVRNHDTFHSALVQLPFCGIITTNYDWVLESAIEEAYTNEIGPFHCEPIDLCQARPYLAFRFLRGLSSNSHIRWGVLHLHGYCRNPKQIILTKKDYLAKYGVLESADGRPIRSELDSLHRKVIWSLLCMHSFVFVGFSMQDEFFMNLLQIVQGDFEIGSDQVHFAIMSYKDEEEQDRIFSYLNRFGVRPIFFHAPRGHLAIDYSGLGKLVFELAGVIGTPITSVDIASITKRMLRR